MRAVPHGPPLCPRPGTDEPLLWYDGSNPTCRYLHADERGSIVAISDGNGRGRQHQQL